MGSVILQFSFIKKVGPQNVVHAEDQHHRQERAGADAGYGAAPVEVGCSEHQRPQKAKHVQGQVERGLEPSKKKA